MALRYIIELVDANDKIILRKESYNKTNTVQRLNELFDELEEAEKVYEPEYNTDHTIMISWVSD